MRYVLGRLCGTEEESELCDHVAYLHDQDKNVIVFQSRKQALLFMKSNRWSPNQISIIPRDEALLPENTGEVEYDD